MSHYANKLYTIIRDNIDLSDFIYKSKDNPSWYGTRLRVSIHEHQLMVRFSGWLLFYEMSETYSTNYITDRGVSYLLREDNEFMERIGVVIKTVEL